MPLLPVVIVIPTQLAHLGGHGGNLRADAPQAAEKGEQFEGVEIGHGGSFGQSRSVYLECIK